MYIKGLQKLTLLDYPEKMACTVFTAGCNFKCPFCHNASLVFNRDDDRISEDEFFGFLNKRIGVVDGVCVTGGEPTLQKDIVGFISKIKELGFLVKLDTNGYRPDVLKYLVDNKMIDYVAMDIKNCKEKYAVTAGIDNLDISLIEESVDYLLADAVDYEFSTAREVVINYNEEKEMNFLETEEEKKCYILNVMEEFFRTENITKLELIKNKQKLRQLLVILKIENGMSYREIEKILEISRETLRKVLK